MSRLWTDATVEDAIAKAFNGRARLHTIVYDPLAMVIDIDGHYDFAMVRQLPADLVYAAARISFRDRSGHLTVAKDRNGPTLVSQIAPDTSDRPLNIERARDIILAADREFEDVGPT